MTPTSTPKQVAERLLKAGADPHAADGDGRTARLGLGRVIDFAPYC